MLLSIREESYTVSHDQGFLCSQGPYLDPTWTSNVWAGGLLLCEWLYSRALCLAVRCEINLFFIIPYFLHPSLGLGVTGVHCSLVSLIWQRRNEGGFVVEKEALAIAVYQWRFLNLLQSGKSSII